MTKTRWSLAAALVFCLAACTGPGSGQAASHSTAGVPPSPAVPREVQSPPASAFATVDWPAYARKFFQCQAYSGQSWDVLLPDVQYVDVTGDGIPDALVAGACPSPTTGNGGELVIFSGASTSRDLKEIALLPTGTNNYLLDMSVTVKGNSITLEGASYSSIGTPLCCPDIYVTLIYQWHLGQFTQIGRTVRKALQ
jgi:hypothetical protein